MNIDKPKKISERVAEKLTKLKEDREKKILEEKNKKMDAYRYMNVLQERFDGVGPADVRKYLERLENPNEEHRLGYTLFHCAARWTPYFRVIDLFLEYDADINLPDRQGHTPLHWAAWGNECIAHGQPNSIHSIAQFLLNNGAELVVKDNHKRQPLHGYTPIHLAAMHNIHSCVMQSLVDADGAKEYLLGDNGKELLDLAKDNPRNNVLVIKVLEDAIQKANN